MSDLVITVCGGGNAAHVFAGTFAAHGYKTYMLATYADECERIIEGMKENGGIKVHQPDGTVDIGKPIVCKTAAECVPQSTYVLLPLPAFAFVPVLEALKPHLKEGVRIGATPGSTFGEACLRVLGDSHHLKYVYFNLVPLPIVARTIKFGAEARCQGWKDSLRVGTIPVDVGDQVAADMSKLMMGKKCIHIAHPIENTLRNPNLFIHPARLWAHLENWKEGDIVDNPFFYEDMDDKSCEAINGVGDDAIAVAQKLSAFSGLEIVVPPFKENLLSQYHAQISDSSTLKSCFRTNKAYAGLHFPFKQVEGGWVPDPSSRYFSEDIPYALCVLKGLAELTNVATPWTDKIIFFAQKIMNKEYLTPDGKLAGRDVGETAAPQAYGLTLDKLFEEQKPKL